MELFETEPVSVGSLNQMSGDDRKKMARAIMSTDGSPEQLKEVQAHFNATDAELSAVVVTITLAKALSAWELAQDINNVTLDEIAAIEGKILDLLEELSPEQLSGFILIMSKYAYEGTQKL